MRLGKYHGLGNDFLVALEADNPGLTATPELARHLCDRRAGIGSDGLILGLHPADPSNDLAMLLLNSDGSPAEISGNGIRCLAQAALRRGAVAHRAEPRLRIETPGGTRAVSHADGDPGTEASFTVDMGSPVGGPPVSRRALRWGAEHLTTVDIGNPHLVLAVDDPASVNLIEEGPPLEADYPEGINVGFTAAVDRSHLELRVWERGAGLTTACGSGAVAAVVAAHSWGIVDASREGVMVTMPGGAANVRMQEGRAMLTGPSTFVADVFVDAHREDTRPESGTGGRAAGDIDGRGISEPAQVPRA